MSLGTTILEKRKKLGLTQKMLAESVQKPDGDSITPQYLNDIEHNRRTPSSPELLKQLANALRVDPKVLFYKAGTLPADLVDRTVPDDKIVAAFNAFREAIEK